jgi:hypothetical protein
MSLKNIILMALIAIFATSCVTLNGKKDDSFDFGDGGVSTDKATYSIEDMSKKVTTEAKDIRRAIKKLASRVPKEAREAVGEDLGAIDASASVILAETAKIPALTVNLRSTNDDMVQKAAELKKLTEKQVKTIEALEEEKQTALRKALIWLILFCTGIIGLCGAIAFYGNPKALFGAVAAIITMVAAMTVNRFGDWFPLIGLISIIIVVAVIVNRALQSRKLQNAVDELVETGEKAKALMDPDKRAALHGDGTSTGVADTIQSKPTKDLVLEARTRLKPKLEHTIQP